jgi:EAL domain-containing protein (putative c-di-GMP-specific phosphodiesterase class I)/GGDEF domain-containing protein
MLNRPALYAAIEASIDATRAGEQVAVVFVRVHGLREVSLRHGYAYGEAAEAQAATVIAGALRPGDQLFRASADRFFVLLPHLRNAGHAQLAATSLASAFEHPLNDGQTSWRARVICGVALYPEHGNDPDLLCRRAEMAHDEARRRGDQQAMYQPGETWVEILYDELRDAIYGNRLQAWFQPVRDLRTGRIAGGESLARWHSERHGPVSPGSFVPFAEQNDLISALTRWSINTTLRQVASLADTRGMGFAINLSPRVFTEVGVVEQLLGALDIWGVAPERVIVEITETALVHDLDLSVRVMQRLRDRGVRISIDDFGTGYASFSYLRRFPATELKIDMSLVAAMRNDQRATKLVRAMIDMAHHLDMVAVAEGIEDQVTCDLLAGMGCDFGQGYHLGRPQPPAEFAALLAAQTRGGPAPSP